MFPSKLAGIDDDFDRYFEVNARGRDGLMKAVDREIESLSKTVDAIDAGSEVADYLTDEEQLDMKVALAQAEAIKRQISVEGGLESIERYEDIDSVDL